MTNKQCVKCLLNITVSTNNPPHPCRHRRAARDSYLYSSCLRVSSLPLTLLLVGTGWHRPTWQQFLTLHRLSSVEEEIDVRVLGFVATAGGVRLVRGPTPSDHRKVCGLELIRALVAPLQRPRQAVAHVVVGQGDVGGQVQLEEDEGDVKLIRDTGGH